MPLYGFRCEDCGASKDKYIHRAADRDSHEFHCEDCKGTMARTLSLGRGLTYFEEGRGRWLENIAPTPQYVTSHGQWRQLLKEHGREWVGAPYGEKGCWV